MFVQTLTWPLNLPNAIRNDWILDHPHHLPPLLHLALAKRQNRPSLLPSPIRYGQKNQTPFSSPAASSYHGYSLSPSPMPPTSDWPSDGVGGLSYSIYYLSFIVAGIVIYQLRTKGGFQSLHHFLDSRFGRGAVILFSVLVGFRLFNEVWSNTMVIGSYFSEQGSGGYYGAILVFTLLTLVYTLKGGMSSSILTDAVQMVLFGVLLFIILGFILPASEFSFKEYMGTGEWKMSAGVDFFFVALIQVFSYPFHDAVLTDRGFFERCQNDL